MTCISAVIITRNEEHRIAEAILSLACCDEVVVVDAESSDRTREIANACGARVIVRPWEGFSRQKNFAASLARHEWILSVDADERVSIELSAEILAWKRQEPRSAAGEMPRRVFYLGGWIGHSGWYPDRKIRLYDRRHAQWEGELHEGLVVDGRVERFAGDLLHFPFRSWDEQRRRADRYTQLAADHAKLAGKRGNVLRLALLPGVSFVKAFFLQAGFLDGWRGAAIAYAGARYVFLRELRILR